ncbi:MAG: uroporphyrinogen-III synthase, partial [Deltaproteobacteria bacterium]|nr:uroporphyrinogen-III synthase [Deltaproteobacteria bacterium]
ILPVEIKRLGGKIDVVPSYKTIRPAKEAGELKELLLEGGIDIITFTSSSTVTNFVSIFKKAEIPELLKGVVVACIGPITADTAKENGIKVDIMPKEYTIPALTSAMAGFYKKSILKAVSN